MFALAAGGIFNSEVLRYILIKYWGKIAFFYVVSISTAILGSIRALNEDLICNYVQIMPISIIRHATMFYWIMQLHTTNLKHT
jgi:hypothetical protein